MEVRGGGAVLTSLISYVQLSIMKANLTHANKNKAQLTLQKVRNQLYATFILWTGTHLQNDYKKKKSMLFRLTNIADRRKGLMNANNIQKLKKYPLGQLSTVKPWFKELMWGWSLIPIKLSFCQEPLSHVMDIVLLNHRQSPRKNYQC